MRLRSPRSRLLLLGALLAGCAGGRGSSGFDISAENAAIARALATRQCVEIDGLTVCPANESTGAPSPTSTPTTSLTPPVPTPTPAPGVPTPTVTPTVLPHVVTGISGVDPVNCIHEQNGACRFTFSFVAIGFPPTASFLVAARDAVVDSPWAIGTLPIAAGEAGSSALESSVVVPAIDHGRPASLVQFAVLVFALPRQSLLLEVRALAETGADFAFVTPALPLNVIVNPPTSDSSPHVTYVGIARSDHVPIVASMRDDAGRPVFVRSTGFGMSLVIEARAGSMGPIGTEVFDTAGGLPDLQVIVSQLLGNGSTAVCDRLPPNAGGVPATTPFEFSDLPTVVNAINDLSCRAENVTFTSAGACTTPDAQTKEFAFIDPSSTIQYCVPIDRPWAFNAGDTVVAVRVRDIVGQLSEVEEIVVRITSGPRTLR